MRSMRIFPSGTLHWYALIWVIAIVGNACFAPISTYTTGVARTAPKVDFQAPDFSLSALDGRPVSLSDWRGQVVLINFWATWCDPCRTEMPEIQAAYQAYRNRNFVVLPINVKEDEQAVAQFAEAFHLTMPVLLDHDGSTARRYRVRGLPTSFLVDPEGVIRAIKVGEMSRAYIDSQLAALGVPAVSELTTPVPATPAQAAEEQQLNLDEMFPPGKGRDLAFQTCTTCHPIEFVAVQRKTRDAWLRLKVYHRRWTPRLSDKEDEIYEYLIANFYPGRPFSNFSVGLFESCVA